MSENTDKPLTVEPGPVVLRNCWTCGHRRSYGCQAPGLNDRSDATTRWLRASVTIGQTMPSRDADNCPGWKPKPEQANTDREQLAIYGADPFPAVEPPTPHRVVRSTGAGVHGLDFYQSKRTLETGDELRTGSGDCKFCGTPFSWQVYFGPLGPRSYIPEDCGCKNRAEADTITIKRAEWDATLARIAELERRVGANSRGLARHRRTR